MADELKMAEDVAQILQGVIWSVFAILLAWKGLPAAVKVVHELGIWRGEVGSRLSTIEGKQDETLRETRTGFRENKDDHKEIRGDLTEHGERLASLEATLNGGSAE